jgi:hypothetical protein
MIVYVPRSGASFRDCCVSNEQEKDHRRRATSLLVAPQQEKSEPRLFGSNRTNHAFLGTSCPGKIEVE